MKPTSAGAPRTINWDEVRARLHQSTQPRSDSGDEASVLQQRARELSKALVDHSEDFQLTDTVVFELQGQHFAVPAAAVREAFGATEITSLPGLSGTVRGLANVRSRVVPVFDLAPLLELAPEDAAPTQLLILVVDAAEFAVLANRMVGSRQFAENSIRHNTSAATGRFVRGLTDDRVILLDLPALVAELSVSDREGGV